MEKPSSLARPASSRFQYSVVAVPRDHGAMAPSASDSSGLGMMSSSSTSSWVPMPLQAAQAPKGLLNEKERGSISSMASGCSLGQARFSENARMPVGVVRVEVDEFGQHAALGQAERRFDGVGQALADAFLDHQPVHHHLDGVLELLAQLGRIAELDELAVHPGAGIALRGQFLEEVDEFALAAADHGASTWKRVPSSSSSSWSTICCGVCLATGSPQTGQCGRPTRAHSRRM